METFRLYAPEPRFEEAYKHLRREALFDHEPAPAWLFPSGQTYLQWLASLAASRRCRDWRYRFVPYRVYFLVDASGCIIGAARLLMGLNEPLARCGGQLSLWIIPSRRGRFICRFLLKLQASNSVFPSLIVRTTLSLPISWGGQARGSPDSRTRSARLPGASVPFSPSSPYW